MADNTGKVAVGIGLGAALLGVLATLGSKKPATKLQGAAPRKGCNVCGR